MNSPADWHGYAAALVFESSSLEAVSDPSVDIQFRLVRAPNASAAFERALELGKVLKSWPTQVDSSTEFGSDSALPCKV